MDIQPPAVAGRPQRAVAQGIRKRKVADVVSRKPALQSGFRLPAPPLSKTCGGRRGEHRGGWRHGTILATFGTMSASKTQRCAGAYVGGDAASAGALPGQYPSVYPQRRRRLTGGSADIPHCHGRPLSVHCQHGEGPRKPLSALSFPLSDRGMSGRVFRFRHKQRAGQPTPQRGSAGQ